MKKAVKFLFLTLFALPMLLASCSKGPAEDAMRLMSTVPDDTPLIAVCNLEEFADETGAEIKDGKMVLPPKMQQVFASLNAPKDLGTLQEAGVKQTAMVVFANSYNMYITGLIDDADKFEQYLKQEYKAQPVQGAEGLTIIGNGAFTKEQFWVALNGSLNAETVAGYVTRTKKNSFASNDCAKDLADSDSSVTFQLRTAYLFGMGGGLSKAAGSQMILQGIFKDAAYVRGTVDFSEKDIEIEASILNSKYKPTELLLPFGKITSAAISKLNGNPATIAAVGITPNLIEQVSKSIGSLGGMFDLNALKAINGTVALGISNDGNAFSGIIDTQGSNTELMEFLSKLDKNATVTGDATHVFLQKGTIADAGNGNVALAAKELEGAYIGFVSTQANAAVPSFNGPVTLVVEPDGKSVKIEIKAQF